VTPNFKVSDSFQIDGYAQFQHKKPDVPYSQYETPALGFFDAIYASQWTPSHDQMLGKVCRVLAIDDSNGILCILDEDVGYSAWVCISWVTPAQKEDTKKNALLAQQKAAKDQIDGAQRRRDLNLEMLFNGCIAESSWRPGDWVRVINSDHPYFGKEAQLLESNPTSDGLKWTISFPNVGVGGGWTKEHLEWLKM